jgi:hypothetical protein
MLQTRSNGKEKDLVDIAQAKRTCSPGLPSDKSMTAYCPYKHYHLEYTLL